MPVVIEYAKPKAPPPPPEKPPTTLEESVAANFALVVPILKEASVSQVGISFSGSGDSGDIDAAIIDGKYDHPVAKQPCEHWETQTKWEMGLGINKKLSSAAKVEGTVEECLHQIANDWAESTGVNWYDNEGGYGEVNIDLLCHPPKLDANIGYYEQVAHDARGMELPLGGVPEVMDKE